MARKLKVYIAAPWRERKYAQKTAQRFRDAGFEVTSRWLSEHLDKADSVDAAAPEVMRAEALHDIEDVVNADLFVLLNTQARGEETSGKAVETGVAIMTFKGIILVGERTNVFHWLEFPVVGTVEEAIETAKDYPWQPDQAPNLEETIH